MADVLGLTSDIGTWLAILLALIALVGIVGPILVLRRSRSERNQALKAIYNQKTGYVTRSFLFGLHGINVPYLEEPPTFHTLSRPSRNVATLDVSSSSGWINLAALIEFYTPGLTRSNKIHIYGKCAWLPCHRFWIFAIGLRGRYDDRLDQGRSVGLPSSLRLKIQAEGDNNEGGYGTEPSTEKLDGITGTLWWKRSLNPMANEAVMDQIYFQLKRTATGHVAGLDITPLSTLFWLSMGCLPLKYSDGRACVFDLKRVKEDEHYKSRRTKKDPNDLDGKFWKFACGNDSPSKWASEMGADMSNRWYLKEEKFLVISKGDLEKQLEAERGEWYRLRDKDDTFFRKSDIHCLALAVLLVEISPKGFLFDLDNSLFDFIDKDAVATVPNLLQWTLKGAPLMNIQEEDVKKLKAAVARWELWENCGYNRMIFSRQDAEDFYEMDEMFRNREWDIPLCVQHIIAVLAICSKAFQEQLKQVANVDHDVCTISVEVDSVNNLVRTATTGSEPFEHILDFSTVFQDYQRLLPISPATYNQHFEIVLSALRGCMRCSLFCHSLDSTRLVDLIQGLEDIVYVSPGDRAPRLHQIRKKTSEGRAIAADDDDVNYYRRRALRLSETEDFEYAPRSRRRSPSPGPEQKVSREESIIRRNSPSPERSPPRREKEANNGGVTDAMMRAMLATLT